MEECEIVIFHRLEYLQAFYRRANENHILVHRHGTLARVRTRVPRVPVVWRFLMAWTAYVAMLDAHSIPRVSWDAGLG